MDYEKLAERLLYTTANVYSVAKNEFGEEVEEEAFDHLRDKGIFRCDECSAWQRLNVESEFTRDLCETCEIERDEEKLGSDED